MDLPKAEEQLMKHLWAIKEAFMKDLLAAYPEPKPAASTVATLLKRLQDKKVVGYKTYGSVRAYFPLISKEHYFSKQIGGLIHHFFNGSSLQFASFFTQETDLSEAELQTLKEMIESQIKARKDDSLPD